MTSLRTLKKLFSPSYQGTSTSFLSRGNYSNKNSITSIKFPLALGFIGYLYFNEELFSVLLTQAQMKYYNYRTLIKNNKENYERSQYSKKLLQSFDPESRIKFLSDRISTQLEGSQPFEGDFLSSYVNDRIQEIKENGAQIYLAQKGGGKTLDALRIARDWKKEKGPVLFFDRSHYNETGSTRENGILARLGIGNTQVLREVLQQMDPVSQPFDIVECVFNLFIVSPKAKMTAQVSRERKQLLMVIDDADDLVMKSESKRKFLLQLKELMKEDLVKVLFLCRDIETKNKLKEEFDAGVWKGISKGSPNMKSKPVTQDYLNYIREVTGLKNGEVDKFFFYFGVDYSMLKDLKMFQKWQAEKQQTSINSIDDFIELKVKEYAQVFKETQLDKPLIKVCQQMQDDSIKGKIKDNLTPEDQVRLAPVIGPQGWVSFKYAAAAYFLCGEPWKNVENNTLV